MPWVIGGAVLGGALISSSAAGDAADSQASATDRGIAATERQFNTSRADLATYRDAGQAALMRLRQLLGLPTGSVSNQFAGRPQPTTGSWWDVAKGMDPNDAAQALAAGYFDKMPSFSEGDRAALTSYLSGRGASVPAAPGQNIQALAPGEEGSLLRKFNSDDLNADPVYNSGLEFGLDEGRKAIERRASASGGYDSGAALRAVTRFGNDYGTTKAEGAYGRFIGNQSDVYGRLSGIAGMGAGATNVGVNAGGNSASNLASLYSAQGNAAGAAGLAGANAISGGISNAANFYGQSQFVNRLEELYGGGGRTPKVTDTNLIGPD